jgi:hypothetical protein
MKDGNIIAIITTAHLPRNDAAPLGHDCPGIRIHTIDIIQPPGIGVYGFCEDLLRAMRVRIDEIHRDGWDRPDCSLNLDGLMADHQQRERLFSDLRCQRPTTNWNDVRTNLQDLVVRIGAA